VSSDHLNDINFLRIIKFILNLSGLYFMAIHISSGFIVSDVYPNCDEVTRMIWIRIKHLLPCILFYLAVSTVCNFLGEKYLERQKETTEFILIFLVSVCLIIGFVIFKAFVFYCRCGQLA